MYFFCIKITPKDGGEYVSNEVRDKAYKDFCAGMKYKAIAEKYKVSLSTVKSWATRHWKVATKAKKLQPQPKKLQPRKADKKLKERLLESVDDNEGLTEKRRLFCLYYATSHNALQAYLKAYKCTKETAMTNGPALLRNTQVAARCSACGISCEMSLISGCRIYCSTA